MNLDRETMLDYEQREVSNLCLYLEYRCATLDIGRRNIDLPVKSARSHEGGVEDVHSVRGSQHDHIGRACVETVHLHQKLGRVGIDVEHEMLRQFSHLIEGVLSLRLTTNIATTPLSAHCVNLVDEENTGRGLAGRGKHVPGDFDMGDNSELFHQK